MWIGDISGKNARYNAQSYLALIFESYAPNQRRGVVHMGGALIERLVGAITLYQIHKCICNISFLFCVCPLTFLIRIFAV